METSKQNKKTTFAAQGGDETMDVTYRDYKESDFGDFSDMVFRLYAEDPEGLPISVTKIMATVRECRTRPEKLRIIMICAGEAVIGYSILVYFWSNEYGGDILHIDELFIREAYRGRGIASDFIKNHIGSNENIAAVAVETTPSNAAAKKLYNNLGFGSSMNDHLTLHLRDQTP